MRHPSEAQLALYSGGDVSGLSRFKMAAHMFACAECRNEIRSFEAAIASYKNTADEVLLPGQWDRISAEIGANIRLGLEAAECVGDVPVSRPERERLSWHWATVMAGMLCVLSLAWWLNPVHRRYVSVARDSAEVLIRTTPAGLEMEQNGHAMTLMHHSAKPMITSTPGMLRARFVDSETGQVTINNVYTD
jgi:hypothetical protein